MKKVYIILFVFIFLVTPLSNCGGKVDPTPTVQPTLAATANPAINTLIATQDVIEENEQSGGFAPLPLGGDPKNGYDRQVGGGIVPEKENRPSTELGGDPLGGEDAGGN